MANEKQMNRQLAALLRLAVLGVVRYRSWMDRIPSDIMIMANDPLYGHESVDLSGDWQWHGCRALYWLCWLR